MARMTAADFTVGPFCIRWPLVQMRFLTLMMLSELFSGRKNLHARSEAVCSTAVPLPSDARRSPHVARTSSTDCDDFHRKNRSFDEEREGMGRQTSGAGKSRFPIMFSLTHRRAVSHKNPPIFGHVYAISYPNIHYSRVCSFSVTYRPKI
jgi:hypothetical protein